MGETIELVFESIKLEPAMDFLLDLRNRSIVTSKRALVRYPYCNMIREYLSFPDSLVLGIDYSIDFKYLVVHLNGAWFDSGGGVDIGESFLKISDWNSVDFRLYKSDSDEWVCIEDPLTEPLEDICESSFNDDGARIAGFSGESGKWVEWKFHGTSIKYELSF